MKHKKHQGKNEPVRPVAQKASPDIQALFAEAVHCHQSGRLEDAERRYRQVLAVYPHHADSLNLLGVLACQVRRYDLAVDPIRSAITIKGTDPSYYFNLGFAFKELGRLREAMACYRRAIGLQPDYPDLYNNLGIALKESGRRAEAIVCYHRALNLKPDFFGACYNHAVALQEQGCLGEAVANLRKVLDLNPGFPDAYNNLGVALRELEKPDQAVVCFRMALILRPGDPDADNNLGNVLQEQGKLDEAAACYRRALAVRPKSPDGYNNLGSVYYRQGRLDEAITCIHKALDLRPNYPDACNNLGNVLKEQGRLDEAFACIRRAIDLKPNDPETYGNLGVVFQEQGRLDQAVACIHASLVLRPNHPDTLSNLGVVLQEQGLRDEAISWFRKALVLRPNDPGVLSNLGVAFQEQGRLDEAITCIRQAIDLKPDDPGACNNLGIAFQEQGQLDEAVVCFRQAIERKPRYPDAHFNLALALLLKGNYRQGFEEYEWRLINKKRQTKRAFLQPRFSGEQADGRTILLWAEQGLGDTIQFVRYVSWVVQAGWKVILEVQPPLYCLLESMPGITLVTQGETLPDFDVHCSLLSLSYVLGSTLDTIPADVPYLRVDPERALTWRQRLGDGFRVGLVWAGNPKNRIDRTRSCPLAVWAPLLEIPEIRWFSLQKGPRSADLEQLSWQNRITDLDQVIGDFVDTAAIIATLDLVITVDTAVVHLAGALGRPCWVPLAFAPDWRWLMDREDSPWYPTVRLFRQANAGDWAGVFSRIVDELRHRCCRHWSDCDHND